MELNLVVIRAAALDRSQAFYEALGLTFVSERHGTGPEHLAATVNGVVFEIYPLGKQRPTSCVRIGFSVCSVSSAVNSIQQLGFEVATTPTQSPRGLRAVVVDPDGHRVELTQRV